MQERTNSLTTTFPFLVSKLVDAHWEVRETTVLSHFRRNVHPGGQSNSHQRYSSHQQSQKMSYYGTRQGGGGGMGNQVSGGG